MHTKHKDYRNLLSALLKRSKKYYYDHSFDTIWNDTTWKGTKSTLSNKNNLSDITKNLASNYTAITFLLEIPNIFNNYFTLIPAESKVNTKFSRKQLSNFLKKGLIIPFF